MTVIGLGSNLIVRDGGVRGVVIRLGGRGFGTIEVFPDGRIAAGAAALDAQVAKAAADTGLDGLAFLRGVPGSIGGALRMNAGATLKIVALSEIYGVEKVQRALEDAWAYQAFSCEYIANILEQRERPVTQPGALHLTRQRDLLDSTSRARPLAL